MHKKMHILKRIFDCMSFFSRYLVFSDVVDIVLNIRSELFWDLDEFRKNIMLGELDPP